MPLAEFTDNTTGQIVQGINFGGSNQIAYEVSGTPVYATAGGTSITTSGNISTLNPLGLTSNGANSAWEVISHQDINTCAWRVTVQNSVTQEVKSGVYPFNLDGNVYQLECGGNEWVMASCGGYAIVDEGGVSISPNENLCFTLTGTGENITRVNFGGITLSVNSNGRYAGSGSIITPKGYKRTLTPKNNCSTAISWASREVTINMEMLIENTYILETKKVYLMTGVVETLNCVTFIVADVPSFTQICLDFVGSFQGRDYNVNNGVAYLADTTSSVLIFNDGYTVGHNNDPIIYSPLIKSLTGRTFTQAERLLVIPFLRSIPPDGDYVF